MSPRISGPALALSLAVLAVSFSQACSSQQDVADLPRGSAGSEAPAGRFVGNVVETMDAGTYTYVELDRNGERIWVAGPQTEVAVGEEIAVSLGLKQVDFESKTLGRQFETLYFADALKDPAQGATPDAAPGAMAHAGEAAARTHSDPVAVEPGSIEKPAGGYRIAEVWDRRTELAGQQVTVRGRVVKMNSGILGKNWLHLQDGSGAAESGTHDITVTSQGQAEVGDVVTVRGTVAVDQDFGAGYRYDVIVEEATVEEQI